MIASRTLLAAALATGILVPATAEAAVIPGLFNTGVDANGAALVGGDGLIDPHYLIVASTSPGYAGQQATTYTHPNYWPNDADSRWVSLSGTGGPGENVTIYRLSFSLSGLDPATAQIAGAYAADNLARVYLNGLDTGWVTDAFQALRSFSLTSGFVSGVNTLDFQVTDGAAPGALRVDSLMGVADVLSPPAGIPEPATWAMMLIGFFGMGGVLRGRRLWASTVA